MDLRSAITCFCAATCFYHDKRSPSFTGERRIRRAVLPETVFESACSNGDLLYFICVCQRRFRLASPRSLGSHVKTYSARAPEEAPHFWLIYVIIWLYVLTPFFRYVVQHIPDSVLSGLVVVILIFQILGTYWDTLYYNSIASGILGSFAGVFYIGILSDKRAGAQKVLHLWSGNPFCLSGSPSYLQWGTISSLFI